MDMYILIYLKWITSKDLLYRTWNFAQCYLAAWMGGEFGGEWILVHVSLRKILVIPQYKLKVFKKFMSYITMKTLKVLLHKYKYKQ